MSVAAAEILRERRFAVRFLGRPWGWLWLAGAAIPSLAGWALMALPARGSPADQRIWFLWSGNVLLAMFLVTLLFSARKWSIKLPFFRDFGRATARQADAAWGAIQEINRRARRGAYGGDEELLDAAQAVLATHRTDKVQRAEIREVRVAGRDVRFVGLVKREPFGRLEPWLEMHMGLGTVACLAVWLHADFLLWHHVGWLLVGLSTVVLLSGLAGALFFRVLPPAMARADPGIPYEEAGVARATYARCLDGILGTLDDGLRADLVALRRATGSVEVLRRRNADLLSRIAVAHPEHTEAARDLAVMAGSRDFLLWNTARARRLDRAMRLWRWLHVPLSVALFLLIALHVVQVLWY